MLLFSLCRRPPRQDSPSERGDDAGEDAPQLAHLAGATFNLAAAPGGLLGLQLKGAALAVSPPQSWRRSLRLRSPQLEGGKLEGEREAGVGAGGSASVV